MGDLELMHSATKATETVVMSTSPNARNVIARMLRTKSRQDVNNAAG